MGSPEGQYLRCVYAAIAAAYDEYASLRGIRAP